MALLAVTSACVLRAQESPGSISGTVKEEKGSPVAGATVYLSDLRRFATRSSVTDGRGAFNFPSLAAMNYYLVVTAPGYYRFNKFAFPLAAGQKLVNDVVLQSAIPEGFTLVFNDKDLTGWHVSKTSIHGGSPDWRVVSGVLLGTQNPFLRGGLLVSNKKYRNFEVYAEIWPDFGCDGGIFLRSTEAGEAYQITIDYLQGGRVGGLYGERLQGVRGGRAEADWQKVWKREDWNKIRARIEGDVPHIQAWLNDTLTLDFTDTANHSVGGAVEGYIGLQVHMLERWKDGGFQRFRNVAVKELK